MKLTNKQIKQLIREELQNVLETQKSVGLSQGFGNEELKKRIMNFIMENPKVGYGHPKREEAEMLLSIVSNAVRDAVRYHDGTDSYILDGNTGKYIENPDYIPQTTPEETEQMRDEQGKLKMVKAALMSAMGVRKGGLGKERYIK